MNQQPTPSNLKPSEEIKNAQQMYDVIDHIGDLPRVPGISYAAYAGFKPTGPTNPLDRPNQALLNQASKFMEQAVQLTPPLLRNGYSYNEETEKIELRIADDFLFYHQYGVSMTTLNEMMRPIHLAHQPQDPSINQAIAQLSQEAQGKLPQIRAELWQTLREDLKPLGFEIQEYQDPDSVFLKPHIEYRHH